MAAELKRYIDPSFIYNFEQGPARVVSEEDARQNGLNCVSLAHLALETLFDHRLPPELHCYEMFRDEEHFRSIDLSNIAAGDIVFFGRDQPGTDVDNFSPEYDENNYLLNWRDSPVNHVGIFTGECQPDGGPLLLHATDLAGTNTIWPLGMFARHRYKVIRRIARLKLADDSTTDHVPTTVEHNRLPGGDSPLGVFEPQLQSVASD